MKPIFTPKPKILSKIINFTFSQDCLAFKEILVPISDWWYWVYFHANFRKFACLFFCCWKYVHQFLHWIRGHHYTRRLILWPISVAHPRLDRCSKNPPPPVKQDLVCQSNVSKLFNTYWSPFAAPWRFTSEPASELEWETKYAGNQCILYIKSVAKSDLPKIYIYCYVLEMSGSTSTAITMPDFQV